MKTVYLKVDEEIVDGAGKVVGAEGTTSTDILVEFSEDWEPLSKYATTRDAKGLHPEVIVITELMKEPIGEEEEERFAYRFTLSGNATCEEGLMSITFTGYEIENGNETQTLTNTAMAKLRVLPSDYAEMDDGSVTPSIAQQLQSEIDEIKDDISIATHAQEYAEAAEESASDAAGSAESAEGFASNAEDYATLSRSYARGDTDSRQGEETDNAKYYKELAEQYAGVFVVEDNLESTSATHSLSANQGRVLDGKITDILNSVGESSGIASLDATGRIPYTQLPESAMEYQGTWNASTNTPTLTQGVGDSGDFYVVSTAGTWSGITFNVNDRVIYDGDQELWVRLGAGEVISVNNKSGVVTLNADDIPFDPTGSTLLSTNTEDAIKEAARVGGGMVAKFNITSDAGSTVTVTMPSGTTVTATQKTGSTTEWEANTTEYGTHTLTATLNGQTATTTVVVDTCKVYMVTVTQFSATITVTYPNSATSCTCVGTNESYTATTNPQTFTVHSADTYTITVTNGTATETDTVTITTDGQSESVTITYIPVGSTVTPTDDIQTWLHCADIWDKSYTTLSEVLADTATLSALIASQNACDYLVRCTEWAGIGLVPTMTSDTTPSGVASGDSVYSADYQAYKAFDNNASTLFASAYDTSASEYYLEYDFPTKRNISGVTLTVRRNSNTISSAPLTVQAYVNGSWTDIATITIATTTNDAITASYTFTETQTEKIRLKGTRTLVSGTYIPHIAFASVQYWANLCSDQTAMSYIGLNNYCANTLLADSTWLNAIANSAYIESVLNVKVPTMTSNNTPSGVASASSIFTVSYWEPYMAFDNDSNTGWLSGRNLDQTGQWLKYTFPTPQKCIIAKLIYQKGTNATTIKLQGSSDDTSWTDLTNTITLSQGSLLTAIYLLNNVNFYSYYKFYIVSGNVCDGYIQGVAVYELQFYGREDV